MITIIDLTNTAKYSLRPSNSTPGAWTIDFTKNGKKLSTRFDKLESAYANLQQKSPEVFPKHLSQAILIRNSSQAGHYTVMYYDFQTQQYAQMRCDSLPAAKNFAQEYANKISQAIESTQQQTGLTLFEQSYGMSQAWMANEDIFKRDIQNLLATTNIQAKTSPTLR